MNNVMESAIRDRNAALLRHDAAVALATAVHQAIAPLVDDEAPIWVGVSDHYVSIGFYGADDPALRARMRQALGISQMERSFNELIGQFQFKGESATLPTVLSKGVVVSFSIGETTCKITPVRRTIEIVEYEVDCGKGVAPVAA